MHFSVLGKTKRYSVQPNDISRLECAHYLPRKSPNHEVTTPRGQNSALDFDRVPNCVILKKA
jgi:hypothetical protein